MDWSGSPTTRQVATVTGERAQEGVLCGVGVLVLVDEDLREPAAYVVAMVVRELPGPGDQVGVVEGVREAEDLEVLLHEQPRDLELGHPLAAPEVAQVGRVQAALAGAGPAPTVPRLRSRASRRPPAARRASEDGLGGVGEQGMEDDVLLGRGQQ